jgi:SAM-dependent methyltransferase
LGKEVKKGRGHTIPWLDLSLDQLRQYIRGDLGEARLLGRREPKRFVNMHHGDLHALGDVAEKDVLCLSCGGGQQSAVFALLGARVTVVDIAEGQLEGDREAADHFGYDVRTVYADARDLSSLQPESIDIVWGMTPCYVPSIREIYAQVARVLRPGGLYRTDVTNPTNFVIAWDGGGYRINRPYCEPAFQREDGAIEFRHYMDDIFNGLSDNGLLLSRVEDHGRERQPPPDVEPGSYSHEGAWIGGGITIFAKKADF